MKTNTIIGAIVVSCMFSSCASDKPKETPTKDKEEMVETKTTDFEWVVEDFADIRVLRYQIPGWDKLTLQQQKLVYFLTQAGYEGRDIIWDQNYRHNITIRKALENIVANYKGDQTSAEWNSFMDYTKRIWFSNGIHHHYANYKFTPEFSKEYFNSLLSESGTQLDAEIVEILFDPSKDAKKVSLDSESDLVLSSAINFYDPEITQAEAEAYYKSIVDTNNCKS